MTVKTMTRKDFEAEIIARAWKDESFKAKLLKDPKVVMQEEVTKLGGPRLPEDIKITILEESPKNVYMVLPATPLTKGAKLTDDQLQGAVGGTNVLQGVLWS